MMEAYQMIVTLCGIAYVTATQGNGRPDIIIRTFCGDDAKIDRNREILVVAKCRMLGLSGH
jgi:hypothetical protein